MTERWPHMMKRATAAAYCDLSEGAFVREIMKGNLPAGVLFGGREHWYRPAMDAALAKLAGEDTLPAHKRRFKERHSAAA